ncbi:hypothetical protein [Methylocaldum sp.]|uniref:hypothetical protein n=1 Tax=Methylocaldum sp. TaxID=1969727 RepID=UPI0032209847
MGVDEDLSPKVMRKAVHLATKLSSFESARESVAETLEVELTTKRIERLAERIGSERVDEREQALREWVGRPLVEKLAAPAGVKAPAVVCATFDGGRMQRCDLPETAKSHWCETKVGALLELKPTPHANDPCPELPDTFRDLAQMEKLTREIHLTAAEKAAPKGEVFRKADGASGDGTPSPDLVAEVREAVTHEPPEVVARDVLASQAKSDEFGKQMAARAWSLGFAAALLKAFVGDGSSTNWGIWEREFKHQGFVPILDFIHALTYVYAAATAGRTRDEGGPVYLRWITAVWQGRVSEVIAELGVRAGELGPPPPDAGETDPRRILAASLTYLVNQQSRMSYPTYRRMGLPITSSHIESTVKQIGRRVKGSEKFWSEKGGEAMLQLRADQLSDTHPLDAFWTRRTQRATGTKTYNRAA